MANFFTRLVGGRSVEVDVPLGEAAAFDQPADPAAVFGVRVKPEVDGGVDDQVGAVTSVHSGQQEMVVKWTTECWAIILARASTRQAKQ